MRHPVDIVVMFTALWLLGSMVIDFLTPAELSIQLVALATGPAAVGTAVCYLLKIPKIDFAIIFASLWLLAAMALEWISPAPLPDFMIGGALAPALIIGGVLHWRRCRDQRGRQPVEENSSNRSLQ